MFEPVPKLKSPAFAPLIAAELMDSPPLPVFVNVTNKLAALAPMV